LLVQAGPTQLPEIASVIVDRVLAHDGILRDMRYLIRDRDPLLTGEFRENPPYSRREMGQAAATEPGLNAFAERFVLSIKAECLVRTSKVPDGRTRGSKHGRDGRFKRPSRSVTANPWIGPRFVARSQCGFRRRRVEHVGYVGGQNHRFGMELARPT